MKNAFSGLTSRLDMAEERVFELETISIETSNTIKHRTNTKKKKNEWNMQGTIVGQLQKVKHMNSVNPRKRKKKEHKCLKQ